MATKEFNFEGAFDDKELSKPPTKELNFEGAFDDEELSVTPTKELNFEGAFEGVLDKEDPIEEKPFEFPRLNENPEITFGKEDALKLIKTYEDAGKDIGWAARQARNNKGEVSTIITSKTYMQTISREESRKDYEYRNTKVLAELDRIRYEDLSEESNMLVQFTEGLATPGEGLISGGIEAAGGPADYLKSRTQIDIPFEHLQWQQGFTYSVGTALGFVAPGAIINGVIKGVGGAIGKVILKHATKRGLIKEGLQSPVKVIGRWANKNPTMAKQLIAKGAGKYIKTAPVLIPEGAAWEYLASGGDVGAAVEGAMLFSIAGRFR